MEIQGEPIGKYDTSRLPSYISNTFSEKFQESINILEQLYKRNKRRIVTYSGGNYSTALVVLSLYMKTVHPDIDLNITYSGTMMEFPQMSVVAHTFLKSIGKKYPAEMKIVYPFSEKLVSMEE